MTRMKRITLIILSITTAFTCNAQCNEILSPSIASVHVTAGGNWLAPPIIQLNQAVPIHISFDDMTHEYHRYTYEIKHCDANWNVSEALFTSDYIEGFYDGNTIDDYQESINTVDDYTHYHLTIPNEKCRLTMSGNYMVTIFDENDDNTPVLKVCFLVVENIAGIHFDVTTSTDYDIRGRHQQLEMNVSYPSLTVTNHEEQIKTVVLQNYRWDNAIWLPKPTMVTRDALTWTHCRQLIFDGGNEYRKFEILDVNHANMGIESMNWDGSQYHAHVWTDEPRNNYVYDEDANGAFVVRNIDNAENDVTTEYVYVHFTLKCPPQQGEIYLNGMWTSCPFKPEHLMTYNEETGMYEAIVKLKQGYYSYQYLLVDENGRAMPVPSEGNFYQTENEYQALVYYRSPTDRSDRLVGYAHNGR